MKIIIPFTGVALMIKKHYFCKDSIISIGSDCHPAYLLSQLHIRKNSLPFDWLATEPLNGLSYVEDNLKNDFRYFVNDLILNEKGNVIAPNYPSAEFLHDGGLEDSALIQEKYSRRVNRFKNIVKTQVIHYLYNIPSSCLETVVDIQIVYDSVINFLKIIKPQDKLNIYIRFDNSYDEKENLKNNEELLLMLDKIDSVNICKYNRELNKYGIWGSPENYAPLLMNLNIDIEKYFLPKIYLKRTENI